ncbi:MAG: protein jag [Eubacteriales bacterium]|nr:protein jag [Eubacteriales bacterium]
MKVVEMEGKTVDEAVFFALNAIDLPIEKVNIEVLNAESKGGFLGIGSRKARVRVSEKPRMGGETLDFLNELFEKMNMDVATDAVIEDETLLVTITGEDAGALIGYRGETLDALQYLASLATNKEKKEYQRILIDAEGYRGKRRAALEGLARKTAARVRRTGRPASIEPMNPYERRILHSALQSNPYVTTQSEGEEPDRHVVVIPK